MSKIFLYTNKNKEIVTYKYDPDEIDNYIGMTIKKLSESDINKYKQTYKFPNLVNFVCYNIKLERIPIMPLAENIECSKCNLVSMANYYMKLKKLNCSNNLLIFLPMIPSCEVLDCQNNKIIKLPQKLRNLKELNCSNNNISFLPHLPECEKLIVKGNPIIYYSGKIKKKFNLEISPFVQIIDDYLEIKNNLVSLINLTESKEYRIEYLFEANFKSEKDFINHIKKLLENKKNFDTEDSFIEKLRNVLDKYKFEKKYIKYKIKYYKLKKIIGGASLAADEEGPDEIDFSKYNTYDGKTDEGWTILSSLPDDNARLNLVQNTILDENNYPTEILKNYIKYKNKEISIPPTILFYLAYKTSGEFDGEFGYNFPYLGSHELEIIKDAIRNDFSDKKIVITPSGIGRLVFDILVCTKNINVVMIDVDSEQIKVFLAKLMDFRKNKFPLNTNIKVVTSDVLELNERILNQINNADIIAVPNLIHFFSENNLNIFISLIDSNLKVNGRLYLFWQPVHETHFSHSVEKILEMFNNFSEIDRKRLYHLMRQIPNVVAWMRGVEDVPPDVKVGPPDKGPINVSLILEKNR